MSGHKTQDEVEFPNGEKLLRLVSTVIDKSLGFDCRGASGFDKARNQLISVSGRSRSLSRTPCKVSTPFLVYATCMLPGSSATMVTTASTGMPALLVNIIRRRFLVISCADGISRRTWSWWEDCWRDSVVDVLELSLVESKIGWSCRDPNGAISVSGMVGSWLIDGSKRGSVDGSTFSMTGTFALDW